MKINYFKIKDKGVFLSLIVHIFKDRVLFNVGILNHLYYLGIYFRDKK